MRAGRALFRDRADAGRRLGERLAFLREQDVVVLGLPRGGVPVAAEVARHLGAALDVLVVRKVGVPRQPELAMGAVGEGGVTVRNERVILDAGLGEGDVAVAEQRERAAVASRVQRFRSGRAPVPLGGRTAVVVDDGIATGATARAACAVARAAGAARVVLAVPACSPRTAETLRAEVDVLVVLETPAGLFAVGQAYDDFRQVTDDEVVTVLRAAALPEATSGGDDPPVRDEDVEVAAGRVRLAGHLTVPANAVGLVVFVHGSGSSRHSPRNRYVAGVLRDAGLATLLFDLLTVAEEQRRANVFDIELLAGRLTLVTAWVRREPQCRDLPLGWFGASTGAAAALWAAAEPDAGVTAIVSRGGRPDLAGPRLGRVRAPTLLIVGGHDDVVLDLNERAATQLSCERRLAVVPGATHLFEEAGTLAVAAQLARDWFVSHLAPAPHPG